jgi:hypothetical protein
MNEGIHSIIKNVVVEHYNSTLWVLIKRNGGTLFVNDAF